MSDPYNERFSVYVNDVQRYLKAAEQETCDQLVQTIPMPDEHKIDLADHLTTLRHRCCEESFIPGIETGLRISREIMVF